MLMLSWLAGMRVGEIAALRFEDVVDASGEVRNQIQLSAEQTKGNEARTVLISSQLKQELVNYTNTHKTLPNPQLPFIEPAPGICTAR